MRLPTTSHRGRLNEGLQVLRRDFHADQLLPPDLRGHLLERVALLEAAAARDATEHAHTARFSSDHGRVVETRPHHHSVTTVDLVGWWHATARALVDALDERERVRWGGTRWNIGVR